MINDNSVGKTRFDESIEKEISMEKYRQKKISPKQNAHY